MPRERREQLILEVAGTVFAREGYHPASMDEIAELAGVSKPMVYAYFGSKEGLYLAYIDRAGRDLLKRLESAAPAGGAPTDALQARITEFLAFVQEHGDGWKVLFGEFASRRPFAERVAEIRARIVDAMRRMLEDAGLPCAPRAADALAHALVGAGESLANWWLEHPEVPREEVAGWYLSVVQTVIGAPVKPGRTRPSWTGERVARRSAGRRPH
jgi:AcrR family transcriptional regulator